MKAVTKHYTCMICGEIVEYSFPMRELWDNGVKYDIQQARKYFLSVARFQHNLNHKGELDKY